MKLKLISLLGVYPFYLFGCVTIYDILSINIYIYIELMTIRSTNNDNVYVHIYKYICIHT